MFWNLSSRELIYHRQFSADQSQKMRCVFNDAWKARSIAKLSSLVSQQPFVGISDMRGNLHKILLEHVNKFGTLISPPKKLWRRQPPPQPQRPLSLYILTDANWQPNDVGGFIKDLVQSMRAKRCPREHVAISFIRFGNDQASIDRLDELDHGLSLNAIGVYVDSISAFIMH